VVPSVGNKNRQISLSRGVVLSQSTFRLVFIGLCSFDCVHLGYVYLVMFTMLFLSR